MIQHSEFFALVIWYNPTEELARNILSYEQDVAQVIIIDNSDTDNSTLLGIFDAEKIIYKANHENIGVAKALNMGCNIAKEGGAKWLLTMDQDSNFLHANLASFISDANKYPEIDNVAILCPICYDSRTEEYPKPYSSLFTKVDYAMTSGNIISLNHIEKMGFFLESFFIDWLDEEICLRTAQHQLQIVRVNSIVLEHFVGSEPVDIYIFGKLKRVSNYNPIRYYYITRNAFILKKIYPNAAKKIAKRWRRLVKRTLLYDKLSKWQKVRYIYLGLKDYYLGKTGKFEASKINE
ncbi:MAG: hypothetical protein AUK44_10780 [Porphyromonadaceae bacterium CG2_30_38_12]|nr:MAG: hypothetical protein AUK44_10780 [Porphyromonadaceae bacterium CG2_30_38_12]